MSPQRTRYAVYLCPNGVKVLVPLHFQKDSLMMRMLRAVNAQPIGAR